MHRKLFELKPGDLFKFEYDYPGSFATCVAIYESTCETQDTCVVYLYNTGMCSGVMLLELRSFTNVVRL